jgi:hypothetical protein
MAAFRWVLLSTSATVVFEMGDKEVGDILAASSRYRWNTSQGKALVVELEASYWVKEFKKKIGKTSA